MKTEKQRKRLLQVMLCGVILLISSFFLFYHWPQNEQKEKGVFTIQPLLEKSEAAIKEQQNKTEKKTANKDTKNKDLEPSADQDQENNENGSTLENGKKAAPSKVEKPADKKESKPAAEVEKRYVMMQIDVKNILDHMDLVNDNVKRFIPSDGILLSSSKIELKEGESVYALLLRVCKEQGIAITATNGYVRYIGNLGEFDAGKNSGWLYTVNGTAPSIGSDSYQLKDNDRVEWRFTVNQGDVS